MAKILFSVRHRFTEQRFVKSMSFSHFNKFLITRKVVLNRQVVSKAVKKIKNQTTENVMRTRSKKKKEAEV